MIAAEGLTKVARVFISYSRRDMGALAELSKRLEERDFDVNYDTRSLPYGEDWRRELSELIQASDTVVWVVSDASIESRWCAWEVSEVERLNKRMIPVLIAAVDSARLPPEISRIQLLPRTGIFELERDFQALVDALLTDLAWVKLHSRLGDRAAEWLARRRPRDRLLRGRALSEAELWRDHRPAYAPRPTGDILELIQVSRRGAARGLVLVSVVATVVAVSTAAIALVAWRERNNAKVAAEISQLERDAAVATVESRESPIGALRLILSAARRNLDDAKTRISAVLPDVYSALFENLDLAREEPPLGGATVFYTNVRAIADDGPEESKPERLLIASREGVLVTDPMGRQLGPPLSGPQLSPAYANAAIWVGPADDRRLVVASGEFINRDLVNPGVEIRDVRGAFLARLLTEKVTRRLFRSLTSIGFTSSSLEMREGGSSASISTRLKAPRSSMASGPRCRRSLFGTGSAQMLCSAMARTSNTCRLHSLNRN